MEALIIEPTEFSPGVLLDARKNKFEISGESRPENAPKFYEPILDWLDNYYSVRYWKNSSFDSKPVEIAFEFKLTYFNSISSVFILDIFKKIKMFRKEELGFKVKWYYDEPDLDMKESGEEFSKMIGFPFEIIVLET